MVPKSDAEETPVAVVTVDPSSEAARQLYVGNIPRTTNNDELQKVFEEHGVVEKVEVDSIWSMHGGQILFQLLNRLCVLNPNPPSFGSFSSSFFYVNKYGLKFVLSYVFCRIQRIVSTIYYFYLPFSTDISEARGHMSF
ncbi:uncharacterized protein LOC111917400 [Lactuca sativa]|uniref:uncharacterized protein LOC111917400 n=1 Tax=Lactuca sativa TaxID=4236 RepID=UPI000CD97F84|nr:uncharacterized protein LOC111917400 [Lactuca sativa]